MSFRDFDLPKVQTDFGLTLTMGQSLFSNVLPVQISSELAGYWTAFLPLGLGQVSEKAKSEWFLTPLFSEVWRRSGGEIAVISGIEWSVDSASGLNGVADFMLCRSSITLYVTAPVLVAVEAKKDNIPDGLGQCAAEMVAAQRFNQKAGKPIDPIYGCVTTGTNWKFLRLSGAQLDIDADEYSYTQPDRILGVLLFCCGVKV